MARTPQMTVELLGRDRKRTIISIGVAIALFVIVFLVSAIAESRGLTNDWFARYPLAVLGFLVVIGAMAVGTAYWNSGLVPSWLVAFAPTFGWLWTVLVGNETAFPEGVAAPFGLAVIIAVPLGTVGYAVGRFLRLRNTEDGKDAFPEPSLGILLGDDPNQLVSWGTRAVALSLATAVLIYLTSPDVISSVGTIVPTGGLYAPFVLGPVAIPVWLAVAMWPAYRGEGLLASWMILFGPFFGAWLTDDVFLGRLTGSGLLVDAVLVLLGAFVLAVVLGTTGFVFGTGLRRAVERRDSTLA